ncbi:MAG: nicotinate phosphoribosyltransferase [Planctomycetota bacterium]
MQARSLSLLTDLYQLTMACGYFRSAAREREAVFHLFFRRHPFGGEFAIACGLARAMEWLQGLRFAEDDLAYLATLTGNDGTPLFDEAFLDCLRNLRFTCDLDAMPEGTVAFAGEPLLRVSGPLIECQIIETALLTFLNFPTLIATKAARICAAARGDPVLEFGLRRAQGMDGGLTASRAAYIGGCAATSNLLAGKLYSIPVRGTHAHSWVMCFESELEAFDTYARALPNNCVLLVDTYDTLEGVRHAVEVGRRMHERGHRLAGIRLDSGDLAQLSVEARRILDEAGFRDTAIVATSDLDEYAITDLKDRGATIAIWGVGTRLATAFGDPALGGVYKLAAVRRPGEQWQRRTKRSDDPGKATTPGILQVRRGSHGDVLYDVERKISTKGEDLLVPVFRGGKAVYRPRTASEARERAREQLESLDPAVRKLADPTPYPVRIEQEGA